MSDARPAFLFDSVLCTGCEACRVACGNANGAGVDTGWRQIHTFNPRRHPSLPTCHLSLACNHCDTPACLLGCPASAYRRDPATGAVLLDPQRCIGCRYCSWVCPYDAPRFDSERRVMGKCTLCCERLVIGGLPACTLACPTGALRLGDRASGPSSSSHPALPTTALGPSLVVAPPRHHGPNVVAPPPATTAPPIQPPPNRKVDPGKEWTLVLFTLALPLLVAWFTASLFTPARRPDPFVFLTVGAAALALSVLHLGRPLRAWRALANLRSSWLSREILFSGLFLTAAGATLLLAHDAPIWHGGSVVALGLVALVTVDRVYATVPRQHPEKWPHSAGAVLTGLFLTTVVAGIGWLAAALGLVRATLHVGRRPRSPRPLVVVRLSLLVGAVATVFQPTIPWAVSLGLALAGEIVDRIAFYAELEPTSPGAAMVFAASRAR